jgi:hypothetical protein
MIKFLKVQAELKAPKNQYNSFGKYNYRSAEDILEALKPLLAENGLVQTITDDIRLIGDRYYIEAHIKVFDAETGKLVAENKALAREALSKKGMDESQITGATSSYARKYALNGLYGIDDTKDADTDEYQQITKASARKKQQPKNQDPNQKAYAWLFNICKKHKADIQKDEVNAIAKEMGLVYNTMASQLASMGWDTAEKRIALIIEAKGVQK